MDTFAIRKPLLITPYGGELKNLLTSQPESDDLKHYAGSLPSIRLAPRSICDLELLATGAFSPLERFMSRADYRSVLETMRTIDGHVFPIPLTLPVEAASAAREGGEVALRDAKNNLLAVMRVEEIYEWDPAEYARKVLGTEDAGHPLVAEMNGWGKYNISGRPRVIRLPEYHDFPELRLSPAEVRARLERLGRPTVVAFQTRNPLHRAHEEMIRDALDKTGGALLLHPSVGLTRAGDVDFYSRVRTYKIVTEKYFDPSRVLLALLPLAMRFAGPREALWHALIRRNFGADQLIVGRDHAGPGIDSSGKPFYEPYAAQELVEKFSEELGVRVVPFRRFVYEPETGEYAEAVLGAVETKKYFELSGTEVREGFLEKGKSLPGWFTRPEVASVLEEAYAPRHRQGVCLWFTGLSGAGKSTVAEILTVMLSSRGRRVTLLDGDIVRTNLSAGLGFDRAGRDANVRRIGFVASEIARHHGTVVCAAISPYEKTRAEVRRSIGGNFVEVYVDTPLDVCEKRDTKGLYAQARRGEIKDFTGIDDVYEPPRNPEITLSTVGRTPEESAREIIDYLTEKGFIK